MKKDNIVSELKKCVSDIEYIHNELSNNVFIDDMEVDFSCTTDTIANRLKQIIHQLDNYKLFIDVRDEQPLGQDDSDKIANLDNQQGYKEMRVDSPFNDGNPVNGVDEQ